MHNTHKPYNFAGLFIESFRVLGRCWKQILASLMLVGLVWFAGWLLYTITPFPTFIIKFFLLIPIFYVFAVLLRVVGKSAAGHAENFYDSCAASRLTSLYLLAFSIMFAVGLITIAMGARMLGSLLHMKWLGPAIVVISFLVLSVRMIYAAFAITLEEEGPMEAASHSWQLSSGTPCFTALGIFLAYHILPPLIVGPVIVGIKFLVPNFNSFAGIFGAGLYLIVTLAITAFGSLVFLNQEEIFPQESNQPTEDQIRPEQDLAQEINKVSSFERPSFQIPDAAEISPANMQGEQPGQMPSISFDDVIPQRQEAANNQTEFLKKHENRPEDSNDSGIKISRQE